MTAVETAPAATTSTKEPVNVVCTIDAKFVMPLGVMLASLVDNFDPERELVIHVISNDASLTDRENIRNSLEMVRPGLKRVAIQWYSLDPSVFKSLHVAEGTHYSSAIYLRIFIAEVLPEQYRRVIYLDSDLVVLADLARLYDSTAGNGCLVHAAHDLAVATVSSQPGVFDYAERGIPPDARYFNAGVMVIDLQQWRERNITFQLVDYLTRHGNQVHLGDQGALNALLYQDWTPLDNRWNQTSDVLFWNLWEASGYSREHWRRTLNDPYIVHYLGHKKPWLKGRYPPRHSYFFKYLRKTVFKDTLPHRLILEDIMGRRLYYQFWKWARNIPGLVKA